MPESSLKVRFARLGPVRPIVRPSGGPTTTIVLRHSPGAAGTVTISAALLLAGHGMSMLQAKRAIEAMLADGEAEIRLPCVPDADRLLQALREAGIDASIPDAGATSVTPP